LVLLRGILGRDPARQPNVTQSSNEQKRHALNSPFAVSQAAARQQYTIMANVQ
jgi:hypothetical protein